MTDPKQLEILDLRHFSASQLGPLLRDDPGAWATGLETGDWVEGNAAGVDAACWLGAALSAVLDPQPFGGKRISEAAPVERPLVRKGCGVLDLTDEAERAEERNKSAFLILKRYDINAR